MQIAGIVMRLLQSFFLFIRKHTKVVFIKQFAIHFKDILSVFLKISTFVTVSKLNIPQKSVAIPIFLLDSNRP